MIAENLTAVADSHMLIWRSWFPGPPVRQHGDQRRFSGAPLDCHEPELLELAYALPFPMTRHAFRHQRRIRQYDDLSTIAPVLVKQVHG